MFVLIVCILQMRKWILMGWKDVTGQTPLNSGVCGGGGGSSGTDFSPSLGDSKSPALGSIVKDPAAATQVEPRWSALRQMPVIPKQTVTLGSHSSGRQVWGHGNIASTSNKQQHFFLGISRKSFCMKECLSEDWRVRVCCVREWRVVQIWER